MPISPIGGTEAAAPGAAARRVLLAVLGCLTLATTTLTGTPSAGAEPDQRDCAVGNTKVTDTLGQQNWRPLHPAKWQFPGDAVILAERGTNPGPPRRPSEYATLISGPEFASVQIDAEVRIDEPVTRIYHRTTRSTRTTGSSW